LKERNPLEDKGKEGENKIKKLSLRNGMGMWTGFIWLRTGTGGGLCELRNATSAS
jgi:hypothetical protein